MSPPPAGGALGLVALGLSATAYGTVPILARVGYAAGLTPVSLLAFRYIATVALLFALFALFRQPMQAPRGQRWAPPVAGALLTVLTYGYLASIAYVPVSVAALVFFTYPMLVVLSAGLLRMDRVGWTRAIGIVIAFVGLVLGLQVEAGTSLDPRGLVLAGGAALVFAVLLLLSSRVGRGIPWTAMALQTNVVAALLFVPLAAILGELAPPQSPVAWTGLVGVTLGYVFGIALFFLGVARSGAVRAAALSNLEPVVSIAGAVLFLGESLTLVQGLGVALVVVGIVLTSR